MHISTNLNQEQHHLMHQNQSLDANHESYFPTLEQRKENASEMLKFCGFDVVHQHGQRISTNVRFNEEQMQNAQWNEIFIGKLPRDMFEDELLPYILSAGDVYKIRYMMDFSGTNRGFCFVKYQDTFQAIRAIKFLDGRLIRSDKPPIGAKMSFDNKCLFIGNIPLDCTPDQLQRVLEKADVSGITKVSLAGCPRNSYANPGRRNYNHHRNYRYHGNGFRESRGLGHSDRGNQFEDAGQFGYIYFATHDDATRARRILLPGEVKFNSRRLTLDWAKSEIPAHIMELLKPSGGFTSTDLWCGREIVSPSWQSLAVL